MSEVTKKIAQIIAHAESTNNAAEAATFMEHAERLMKKHGINFSDLQSAEDRLAIDSNLIKITRLKWQSMLMTQLAGYYGCAALRARTPDGTYMILSGRESGTTTTRLMWPYILKSVMRQIEVAKSENVSGRTDHEIANSIGLMLSVRISKLRRERDGPGASDAYQQAAAVLNEQFNKMKGSAKIKVDTIDPRDEKYANRVALNIQVNTGTGNTSSLTQEN